MELTPDLYAWITSIEIFDINSNFTINDNGNVVIENNYSDQIKNGTFFIKIFENLNSLLNRVYGNIYKMDEKIYSLAQTSEIHLKIKNWTIIFDFIKNYYGIEISEEERTCIIAEDNHTIISLMTKLYEVYLNLDENLHGKERRKEEKERLEEFERMRRVDDKNIENFIENKLRNDSRDSKASRGSRKGQPKQPTLPQIRQFEDSIDINEINPLKDVKNTRSVLEFVIVTLCKALSMKPRQATALLSDGKKYLNHIIIKGLRNNHNPIKTWFQEILVYSDHFINLIEINSIANPTQITKNIEMSLSCFIVGIMSKNIDVVYLCGRVLTKLAYEFIERNLIAVAWDWFVMPNGGLEACIYCLNRHNSSADVVVSLITNYGKYHLYELFNLYLKNIIPNEGAYFCFLSDILENLSHVKQFCDEFISTNIKGYFLDLGINYSVSQNINVKIHSCQFLSELWIRFSFYIEETEGNEILNVFKKLARDRSNLVINSSIVQLFRLLETFAKERNKFAPVIYKTITFLLIEYHSVVEVKEFIVTSLRNIFKQLLSIPISITVEPYTKQISTSLNKTYFFNLIDINFVVQLSLHPRLSVKDAILLLDVLGKVYFENVEFYKVIRGLFTLILSRHLMNEIGLEFSVKYAKILIEAFCKLDKTFSDRVYMVAIANNINPEDENLLEKVDVATEKTQKNFTIELSKAIILEMLIEILSINNKYLNNIIRSLLLIADIRHYHIYSYHNIGLGRVLAFFGDEKNIEKYVDLASMDLLPDSEFEAAIELIYDKIPEGKYNLKDNKKQNSFKLAEDHITKVKQKNDDLENFKVLANQLQKSKEEIIKDSMKKAQEKRSLEFGVKNAKSGDAHYVKNKLIQKEGNTMNNKYNIILQYNIELLDLTHEEDPDIILLKKVIKDYSRFFKFIFTKYCGSIYHPIHGKQFKSIKEISENISPSEILKMFKDHEIAKELITKEEINLIIGLMNLNVFNRQNTKSGMNYDEFIEVFIQLANFAYYKSINDFPNSTISQFVVEMIKTFDNVAKIKGFFPTVDYKHPDDLLTPTEKEICRNLNLKLMINPSIELPEGYKKVLETEIKQYHYVPDCMLKIFGESKKIVLEVLDQIIYDNFFFHILEPFTRIKEGYKARPLYVKGLQDKLLLEQRENRLKKIFLNNNMSQDLDVKKKMKKKSSDLNIRNLKNILSYDKKKFDDPNKLDDEVQMIFDDLEKSEYRSVDDGASSSVNLVQNTNLLFTKNNNNPSISVTEPKNVVINQVAINKAIEDEKKKIAEKEKEAKRIERDKFIKQELEKQKIIKEEQMLKKIKMSELEKTKKEENEKKKSELERKLREKIREELEKIKKLKVEESKKKIETEMKMNLEIVKKKANLNDVFYNNQVKKLKEQFQAIAEERRNNELKKLIEHHQKEIEKDENKKKLGKFYDEEKKIYLKEKSIFTQLNQKIEDKKILMTLDKYGEHIKLIFDIYKKFKVSPNLEDENVMFHDEFQMFCVHFNISNLLLDNDQVSFIFKKLSAKENRSNCLEFNDFILSLIYVSMFGIEHFKEIPDEFKKKPAVFNVTSKSSNKGLPALENNKKEEPEKTKIKVPNSISKEGKKASNNNLSQNKKPKDTESETSKVSEKKRSRQSFSSKKSDNKEKSVNIKEPLTPKKDKKVSNKGLATVDKKVTIPLEPDYTKQIKYFSNLNPEKINLFDEKVLENFFKFLDFEIPFNKKGLETYINIQKMISVKDKAILLKSKNSILLNNTSL